ncbi:MAG: ABC-F family ATP-binding cassette domain-containing protein [Bdellovibrionota bacterium]
MANVISVLDLEKSYGPRTLFRGLSFGLSATEKVGLVGPNGAGKSSLLRLLAKIEEPDKGQVVWTRGLRIGYLPQNPIFNDGSIEEELIPPNLAGDPLIQAKAEELISRLGLNTFELKRDQSVQKLSGGQKKRVALARELMKEPDLLMLDEPTNHLDIESLLWLEEFLREQTSLTLLTVTHDRLFLQNVADVIIDLDPRYKEGLLRIEGSYADYLEARELRLAGQLSQEASRSNDLRHEMQWLRRGAKARQTKQKARQEATYALMDEVKELRTLNRKRNLDIKLGAGDSVPKKLIDAENISKSYGDRILFKDFSLMVRSRSRIALLGQNGRGKTTLIRCLLEQEKIDSGKISSADKISVNYFEQNRDLLNPKLSLLKNLCPEGDYIHLQGQAVYVKSYLDRFHFRREQHDLALSRLSGGEQARLLIAKMMLNAAPVLVLDEPTNDLDIETLDILRDALVDYSGALLLVTHDRFFMEQVCDTLIAFPEKEDLVPGEIPGTLFRFESYLQWQNWKMDRKELARQRLAAENKKSKAHAGGAKNKLSFKEKFELENMEEVILGKEAELSRIQEEINSPDNVSSPTKLKELTNQMSQLEDKIAELYSRWAELGAKSGTN